MLQIMSKQTSRYQVMVNDISGRLIWEKQFVVNPGDNVLPIYVESSGIYFIRIQNENTQHVFKLVVE
jgi:hypothetical protein